MTTQPPSTRHVDGNAVAGELSQIFGGDVTGAMGTCDTCGHRDAVAAAHAYVDGPGVVLRCPGCHGVLMRWVTTPASTWLDMTGVRSLQIAR